MLPTREVVWQTPPAVVQETPSPQTAEPRKGIPSGRILLGAGLVFVLLAVAAAAAVFLLGNSDGESPSSGAEKPPAAITQVVTSTPARVVTKIVTSEPVAVETATPTETVTPTVTPSATPTETVGPAVAPTANQVPTTTPSPIPPSPAFGPITFARDKTDANEPIEPTITFPAGTLRVYALFDYEGMSPDLEWGRTWYRDGEEYVAKTASWTGQDDGTWSLWLFRTSGDPLVPATYELHLYIEGKQVQSATFVITE